MNYGDPSSSRGRAQIPGPNGDPGSGGSPRGNGWSSGSEGRASVTPRGTSGGRASVGGAAPTLRGGSGSASVGRAGAGRASVPVSPAPGGATGRAGAGRASVPVSPAGPAGRASVGAASVGSAGRASVGSAAVGGRASVARAGVPGMVGGGPGGPGGPTGPGRGGRGGRGDDPAAAARAKKRRRINMLIAGFAVFIMLAGIGVVGFTYYSTNVILPEDTIPPLSTTIYSADKKVIAKVGDQNRQLVTINQIPEWVQHAVAAAEDRNFYRHSGVDYKGIARAAWNNLTGGDKQGASTITQQYARNAFDNLNQDTYGRKVKEAILASKLNDKYDKPTIMQHYLNVIYFGRGAYGIQAAAQTYFGKDVSKLTVAEAAVLAALIKQPEPSLTPGGHKGYDPAINPQAALDRWNYVINGMITEGWLDAPNKPAHPTEYPKTIKKPSKNNGADFGVNTPYGNVINYVSQEMRDMKLCTDDEAQATPDKPLCSQALSRGGYRITTTIDTRMQEAALEAAQRARKGSELYGQPKNLMAAVVSIDPRTGAVKAYYGGDNGTGTDYAGKNIDGGVLSGGHSPGSSFKIYTLAAALKEGISVKSRWKGSAFTPEGVEFKVSNAGADKVSCGDSCTLEISTLKSLNVPFYYITEKIGADKVLAMAKQAGVTTMWRTDTNPAKAYDLTKSDPKDLTPSPFFNVIGYGQYPITVLDHANGVATFANQGIYNKAHFVKKVEKQNPNTGKWDTVGTEKLKPLRRIDKDIVADVTSVLEKYPGQVDRRLDDGRKAAEKTGTWELGDGSERNGDAWMIGYTPQLATAVWVGNVDKRLAIKYKDGRDISGARMPGAIFQRFMNDALKGQDKMDFPPAAHIGDDNAGNGAPPPVENPLPGSSCDPLGLFCQDGNNGGGNNGGTTGPGFPPGPGNGGGGGGLLPSTPPRQTY
ncbi:transglycosylase domain-containing protein [Micromonospora sp. NPDC048930]|uniref:transglycosylase domain-containing protein n=1 Tax=Micromonospora sp. NPDC048930 TaxID=3364261 RepID=UPI003714C64E